MYELAPRYRLSCNLVRLWVGKYEAWEFTDEPAEAVRIAEREHEINELERKVGQLTMRVDLFKKEARMGRAANDGNDSIASGRSSLHRARMPTMKLARSSYYYRPRRQGALRNALEKPIE